MAASQTSRLGGDLRRQDLPVPRAREIPTRVLRRKVAAQGDAEPFLEDGDRTLVELG